MRASDEVRVRWPSSRAPTSRNWRPGGASSRSLNATAGVWSPASSRSPARAAYLRHSDQHAERSPVKAADVLAVAAALGEQLVDRGRVRERADLGDRDVQLAFGDQVKDPAQASGGAVPWSSSSRLEPEPHRAERQPRHAAGLQPFRRVDGFDLVVHPASSLIARTNPGAWPGARTHDPRSAHSTARVDARLAELGWRGDLRAAGRKCACGLSCRSGLGVRPAGGRFPGHGGLCPWCQ